MKRKYGGYIIGFLVTVAVGILLRCLYAASPNPVLATLAPINNSPWELGTMVFWPYLPGALVTHRLTGQTGSRSGHCCVLLLMSFAMMVTCWVARPFLDSSLGVYLGVLALGILLYALVLRKKMMGGELFWYTLAILLGIAFVLFTAMPPSGSFFTAPSEVSSMAFLPW